MSSRLPKFSKDDRVEWVSESRVYGAGVVTHRHLFAYHGDWYYVVLWDSAPEGFGAASLHEESSLRREQPWTECPCPSYSAPHRMNIDFLREEHKL